MRTDNVPVVCRAAVCALTLPIVASTAAAPPPQPHAVPAAAVQVELRVAARSLREISERLSRRAGASVTVDRGAADWKATIAYRGSLHGLLSAVARNFGLLLEREAQVGSDGDSVTYRLILPLAERRRLAERRAERRRRESQRQDRDAGMLAEQVRRLLDGERSPADAPPQSPDGSPFVPGAAPLLQLIGTLGPDALRQLSQSTSTDRTGIMDKSPALSLPVSALSPEQRGYLVAFLGERQRAAAAQSPGGTGIAADNLALGLQQLDRARLGFWTLNGQGSQMLHMSMYFPGISWTPDYPILAAEAANEPPPGPGRERDGMAANRSRMPSALDDGLTDLTLQDAGYAGSVLELADAAHIAVVADAFTLNRRVSGGWRRASRGAVLDAICEQLHLKRRWAGGVALLRADGWEELLAEEPPAEVLDRLADVMRKAGTLSPDDLALAAARMTLEQIAGLGRWRSPRGALSRGTIGLLLSHFPLYSWLGSLSDGQRESLFSGGLALAALSGDQRKGLDGLAARAGLGPPGNSARLAATKGPDPERPDVLVTVRGPDGSFVSELR